MSATRAILPAALLLCACSSTSDVLERSEQFAARQNHYLAYWTVADALESYPDDPEMERVFWERRLEYLLDRGRELVFSSQELEAIGELQKALALDPENPVALQWIERAKGKLAAKAVQMGDSHRLDGELTEALKQYNRALSYVPEYKPAVDGIDEVNGRFQDRTDKANDHYVTGSRARGEQHYQQSYYHSGLATELDRSMQKAKRLHSVSARRLAAQRMQRAMEMQEKGFYGAALQEYASVKLEMPDAEGLDERIAQMQAEVDSRNRRRDAEMLLRKGEFDRADQLLTEAFELTNLEKAAISGVMLEAKRRRNEERYKKARDLELEYEFEGALEAYREVEKHASDGFLDVKTRISGLVAAIEGANKAYEAGQAAEQKGEFKVAIDHYEEAVLVYPGFKGLPQHIAELRARQ